MSFAVLILQPAFLLMGAGLPCPPELVH
jgi:hypothetical protein